MPAHNGTIAARLVRLRQEHDPPLTQPEAAELIGVHERTWGRWEQGATLPNQHLAQLTDKFDITARELLDLMREPSATLTPVPDQQLARVEHMLRQLLEHFGIDTDETGIPAPPAEISELLPPPAKRGRRNTRGA